MREPDNDRSSTPQGRDDDRIGALIRIAGPRPSVPAERERRVKASVRAHWRETTERRTWRRTRTWSMAGLAAAATLLLAAGLAAWQAGWLAGASPVGRVEAVHRAAWVATDAGGPRAAAESGARLAKGSVLETGGDGQMAIRTASGHSVRLAPSSRMHVVSARSLALDRGTVYVDSGAPGGAWSGGISISTRFGVVEELGTQYEVSLGEGAIRVRVREGSVSLSGDGATLTVEAGTELERAMDGVVARRPIPPSDPAWTWVGEIAPPFALDSRTLDEFLAWASREGGWRVAYADAGLGASAGTIELSGSIEGLTLREALDAVLPTCGLTHRVDGGVLLLTAGSNGGR